MSMLHPIQVNHSAMTRSLQEALDDALWDLRHWKAALSFVIRNAFLGNAVSESPCKNILEYLKPMYKGFKIYLNTKNNKQHMSFEAGDKGWKDLLKDIA
jgi:hypothetical protein